MAVALKSCQLSSTFCKCVALASGHLHPRVYEESINRELSTDPKTSRALIKANEVPSHSRIKLFVNRNR